MVQRTAKTPVLKYVGRSSVSGLPLEPPAFIETATGRIELPSPEEQKRGFSLKTAEKTLQVARLFPTLYKTFLVKGQKA